MTAQRGSRRIGNGACCCAMIAAVAGIADGAFAGGYFAVFVQIQVTDAPRHQCYRRTAGCGCRPRLQRLCREVPVCYIARQLIELLAHVRAADGLVGIQVVFGDAGRVVGKTEAHGIIEVLADIVFPGEAQPHPFCFKIGGILQRRRGAQHRGQSGRPPACRAWCGCTSRSCRKGGCQGMRSRRPHLS